MNQHAALTHKVRVRIRHLEMVHPELTRPLLDPFNLEFLAVFGQQHCANSYSIEIERLGTAAYSSMASCGDNSKYASFS